MPDTPVAPVNTKTSARGPLFIGYLSLIFLVAVLGVWSTQTQIAGAVVAPGKIQVENNRQVIQHPEGGVVGALMVRDGDVVKAGDPLLRFDDTLMRSEFAIVSRQLNELKARKGRLMAEQDNAQTIHFDEDLLNLAKSDAETADLIAGQERLFEARRVSLKQQLKQLDQQILQTRDQIVGAEAQLTAAKSQSALIINELVDVQGLFDKGLAQASRVSALKREEANLLGRTGQISAEIARLRNDIAGLEVEKLRLVSTRREDAITLLRDIQVQERELSERMLSAQDSLGKMEIHAPVSGVIYDSQVFALQSVISPAQPIMYIVPQDQPLVVSARVDAIHVDQVFVGQDAALRFSSFDQRTTPELFGTVSKVSADVFTDKTSGASFYQVELVPKDGELAKLGDQVLLPGMPVEALIKTGDRSPLSYLLKPVTDYFNNAFRED